MVPLSASGTIPFQEDVGDFQREGLADPQSGAP